MNWFPRALTTDVAAPRIARAPRPLDSGLEPPAPRVGRPPAAAVVAVPVADLRRLPDHRAELVSQGLFGETYRVLERSADGKWLCVRGSEDGYVGWVRTWSVARGNRAAVVAWRGRASWRVDVPWLEVGDGGGALPFGARVARAGNALEGPLGRMGGRAGAGVKRASGRAPREGLGRAIVATASRFLGVPYHWGGRTFGGVDCSGLVQLAAQTQGILLPRDAGEQCLASGGVARLAPLARALARPGRGTNIRPGDLWFFGPNRREVTHVALSSGGLDLIHAYGRVAKGSLDPLSDVFEPELFRFVLGWRRLPRPRLAISP